MTTPNLLISRLLRSALLAAALAAPMAGTAQEAAPKHLTLLGVPSATVAPNGLAFVSASATSDRSGTAGGQDGSGALGFGLGSAEDGLGLQITTHLTSLTRTFGDSGYVEVKAARRLAEGAWPTYAAFTVGNLGTWGDARIRDTSATAAISTFSTLRFSPTGDAFPVMFTLGAGSHIRNFETDPGVFFGAGIGLTPNLGTSVAWSGEYVNLGASFRFNNVDNLGLTTTLYDAFDQKDSQRLAVSVTYVFSDFLSGFAR